MNKLMLKTLVAGCTIAFGTQAQNMQDGLRALDFDRYEGARNIFTQLTQSEPTNGENWYYLGQAYLNLFKEDSARWAYNKGIEQAPQQAANYVGLGELAMAGNKKDEARQFFNKALGLSRGKDGLVKDPKALRLVASALVNTENKITDEALNHIKSALELAPKDYDVLISAGDVYLEMNNGGEAASQYERAEAVAPQNPKAFTRVAAIWLRVRNAEQTFTDLTKALAIDSNYAPALKLMSELYYKSKKYDKAKYYYSKYLQNSEASLANRQRFARILFNSQEYEDALPQILDILKSGNDDVYMYRLAGYSYYEVGEAKKDSTMYRPGAEAMETFLAKIDPAKVLPTDYEYLGKLYSRIAGKDSLTIYYISKAIELAPEKVELNKEAGQIFNRLRKFDQSIYYFETYIAKAPKVSLVDYQLLGLAAYYGKQHAKSDSAFARILELKPDYADGYYWRGINQAALDPEFKGVAARDLFEKYIGMAEGDPVKNKKNLISSYNTLAVYYIKNDNNNKAKELLNKTIALDANNKSAKDLLKQLK